MRTWLGWVGGGFKGCGWVGVWGCFGWVVGWGGGWVGDVVMAVVVEPNPHTPVPSVSSPPLYANTSPAAWTQHLDKQSGPKT